jgi:transposase
VFADLEERRGVFVVEGPITRRCRRSRCFLGVLVVFLDTHGGDPAKVQEVCQDMSEAYLKGTLTYLPQAEITFDRYHIRSHLSKAIDEVRREEAKHQRELLKDTRYVWLKRRAKLAERQRDLVDELLTPARGHRPRLRAGAEVRQLLHLEDPETAEEYLRCWIALARGSELEPLAKFCADGSRRACACGREGSTMTVDGSLIRRLVFV